jgi:hypothetical protein
MCLLNVAIENYTSPGYVNVQHTCSGIDIDKNSVDTSSISMGTLTLHYPQAVKITEIAAFSGTTDTSTSIIIDY